MSDERWSLWIWSVGGARWELSIEGLKRDRAEWLLNHADYLERVRGDYGWRWVTVPSIILPEGQRL
jgi:hypothetical protein